MAKEILAVSMGPRAVQEKWIPTAEALIQGKANLEKSTLFECGLQPGGYNGGDLQPGCLADRLVAGHGQPEMNSQASQNNSASDKSSTELFASELAKKLAQPGCFVQPPQHLPFLLTRSTNQGGYQELIRLRARCCIKQAAQMLTICPTLPAKVPACHSQQSKMSGLGCLHKVFAVTAGVKLVGFAYCNSSWPCEAEVKQGFKHYEGLQASGLQGWPTDPICFWRDAASALVH
eukprot:1161964-Pelagomonas_calceolata.AAC.4